MQSGIIPIVDLSHCHSLPVGIRSRNIEDSTPLVTGEIWSDFISLVIRCGFEIPHCYFLIIKTVPDQYSTFTRCAEVS